MFECSKCAVMEQLANNTAEQALLGGFNKAVDEARSWKAMMPTRTR
ncbi:hypothetical protein [Microbulbifer sp. THAF38]|nr:hypothetical protein [Microbulbifer sp. THAF38]QFT54416.1 hypothetical protein FIU95_07590 [Microbulbifer sp. THAF38]